ncbi:MAG TPA: hypothetical protein ENJ95_00620 [Bacteroidetes bacterium]|nr:hypothetical protein [Bacteroidota bacterium]
MKKYIFILFFIGPLFLLAQENAVVTKNFRFNDGLYLSLGELQKNQPAFPINEIELNYFTNPQTSLTQVENVIYKKTNKEVDMGQVYAVSIGGVPYIQLPKKEVDKPLPTFAALKLRGKICYFTYPYYRPKKITVAAYNPLTGYPFLTGEVEREEKVIVEKMLHFETGEIIDFNTDNLLAWIQEDCHLVETIKRTPREEVDEKLFRLLLIYVDRHEVHIKSNEN